jgi:hypothetical protein
MATFSTGFCQARLCYIDRVIKKYNKRNVQIFIQHTMPTMFRTQQVKGVNKETVVAEDIVI